MPEPIGELTVVKGTYGSYKRPIIQIIYPNGGASLYWETYSMKGGDAEEILRRIAGWMSCGGTVKFEGF